jgi:hypothetical protein
MQKGDSACIRMGVSTGSGILSHDLPGLEGFPFFLIQIRVDTCHTSFESNE